MSANTSPSEQDTALNEQAENSPTRRSFFSSTSRSLLGLGLAKILSEDFALSPANANENVKIYDLILKPPITPSEKYHSALLNGGIASICLTPNCFESHGWQTLSWNVEEMGIKAHQILA